MGYITPRKQQNTKCVVQLTLTAGNLEAGARDGDPVPGVPPGRTLAQVTR